MKKIFLLWMLLSCIIISACSSSKKDEISKLDSSHLNSIFDVKHNENIVKHGAEDLNHYRVEFEGGVTFDRKIEDETSIIYNVTYSNLFIIFSSDQSYYQIYFKDSKSVSYYGGNYEFLLKVGLLSLSEDGDYILMDDGEIVAEGNTNISSEKKEFNSYLIESGLPTELSAYDDFAEYAHKEAVSVFSKFSVNKTVSEKDTTDISPNLQGIHSYFEIDNLEDVYQESQDQIIFKGNSSVSRKNIGSDTEYQVWIKNDLGVTFYSDNVNYTIGKWDNENKRVLAVAYNPSEFGHAFQTDDGILMTVSSLGDFILTKGVDNQEVICSGSTTKSEDKKIYESYFTDRGLPMEISDYDNLVEELKEFTLATFDKK
ncbi:TPA: hypothetical protein ACGO3A_001593 [Streptococcus suis]